MSVPLTPEEIDAIRAKDAARTPGRVTPENVAFVLDAPWWIPRLLATLDAKDAEIARLTKELEEIRT